MPTTPTFTAPARPTVDEWGLYDPEQAGLAALFNRLAARAAPRGGGDAPGKPQDHSTPDNGRPIPRALGR